MANIVILSNSCGKAENNSTSKAIIGADEREIQDTEVNFVGTLSLKGKKPFCNAYGVSKNVVATATHCIKDFDADEFAKITYKGKYQFAYSISSSTSDLAYLVTTTELESDEFIPNRVQAIDEDGFKTGKIVSIGIDLNSGKTTLHQKGQLYLAQSFDPELDDTVFLHDFDTLPGYSGSPIVYIDSEGKKFALATHLGSANATGLNIAMRVGSFQPSKTGVKKSERLIILYKCESIIVNGESCDGDKDQGSVEIPGDAEVLEVFRQGNDLILNLGTWEGDDGGYYKVSVRSLTRRPFLSDFIESVKESKPYLSRGIYERRTVNPDNIDTLNVRSSTGGGEVGVGGGTAGGINTNIPGPIIVNPDPEADKVHDVFTREVLGDLGQDLEKKSAYNGSDLFGDTIQEFIDELENINVEVDGLDWTKTKDKINGRLVEELRDLQNVLDRTRGNDDYSFESKRIDQATERNKDLLESRYNDRLDRYSEFKTSPASKIGQDIRLLNQYAQNTKSHLEKNRGTEQDAERRIGYADEALRAASQADSAAVKGDESSASVLVELGMVFADMAAGIVLGPAKSAIEIYQGKNIVTGEAYTGTDYLFAVIDIASLGFGGAAIKTGKGLAKAVGVVGDFLKSSDKVADIGAVGKGVSRAKEAVTDLAGRTINSTADDLRDTLERAKKIMPCAMLLSRHEQGFRSFLDYIFPVAYAAPPCDNRGFRELKRLYRGIAKSKDLLRSKDYLKRTFDGRVVYKLKEGIDPGKPSIIDRSVHPEIRERLLGGATNLDLMKKGNAPIGLDGKQVNLHHLFGQEPGPMAELSATDHQVNHKVLHDFIEKSFRKDTSLENQYDRFRKLYWKERVKDFE